MKVFLKIGLLSLLFFLFTFPLQAHECESKNTKKTCPCPAHVSTAILNKSLVASSIKIPRSKVLEKRKYYLDEIDRNYYVCPACHM